MAVIAACAAIVGCDPENLGEDTFNVSAEGDIVIPKEGGSQSFTVKSTFDWVVRGVEDAAEWLDVTVDGESVTSDKAQIKASAKEHEIVVSALANNDANREVTLTFFAGVRNKVNVKVKQEGEKGDGVVVTTVADLIANPSKELTYRLTGQVSGFNATYCSFDLKDATGSIYVYSMEANSKAEWADKIKNGGTITIRGNYEFYEAKSQHEIINAVVESYTAAEEGDPDKATDATIAEFIQKADVINYYRLSGKVSSFNDKYCSFDLTDDTGTIYVYSVTDASKTQWGTKIKNGDNVVLRGQYLYYSSGNKHEVVNAIIDSVEEGVVETEEVTGLVVAVSSAAFLVKTATGMAYVYDEDIPVAVKVGDNVTVQGEKTSYNGTPELENYTVTVNSSNNPLPSDAPADLDAAAFDAYSTLFGYVKFSGKLSKSGNYYNLKVKGATKTGSLSKPVTVDESLVGKYADVTGYFVGFSGNGNAYFNVVYTEMALSADQHEGDDPDPVEGGDPNVGENEVGYELTNAEIIASLSKSSSTGDTYADFTIASDGGDWNGNIDTKNSLTYVQFRNNRSSCFTSPEYAKNVKRIVLRFNEKTGTDTAQRTVYAVSKDVIPNLPSQKDDNYNKTSHSDLFANAYGSAKSGNKQEVTSVITVTGTTKQFTLVAYDGAVYINSILVICEK